MADYVKLPKTEGGDWGGILPMKNEKWKMIYGK
jgi:hypothetical protein